MFIIAWAHMEMRDSTTKSGHLRDEKCTEAQSRERRGFTGELQYYSLKSAFVLSQPRLVPSSAATRSASPTFMSLARSEQSS